ncbi:MAG TPA: peptide deformylase [Spirochaetota bacterium]|nr:peptide deformylase [Spirochaetota bacterium]
MLDLVTLGNEKLHIKSEIITEIGIDIPQLVKEMFETMYVTNGIGLSAVQIGVMKRLFVVDIPNIKNGKLVVINPVIKDLSEKTKLHNEGCLSLPGINGDIERPDTVVLEYLDIRGDLKRIKATGLLATCIQHEYDHLEGVLFIDRLSPEEKLQKINEYRKLHR